MSIEKPHWWSKIPSSMRSDADALWSEQLQMAQSSHKSHVEERGELERRLKDLEGREGEGRHISAQILTIRSRLSLMPSSPPDIAQSMRDFCDRVRPYLETFEREVRRSQGVSTEGDRAIQLAERREGTKGIDWNSAMPQNVFHSLGESMARELGKDRSKKVTFASSVVDREENGTCKYCGTKLLVVESESRTVCPVCKSSSTFLSNSSATGSGYGDARHYSTHSACTLNDYVRRRLISLQGKERTVVKDRIVKHISAWCVHHGLWDVRVVRRPEVILGALRSSSISEEYHRLAMISVELTDIEPVRMDDWQESHVMACFTKLKQASARQTDPDDVMQVVNSYYYIFHVLRLLGFDNALEFVQFLQNPKKLLSQEELRASMFSDLGWEFVPTDMFETIVPRVTLFQMCIASGDMKPYFLYLRDVEEMDRPLIVHPSCAGMDGRTRCRKCHSTSHATSSHVGEGLRVVHRLPDGPFVKLEYHDSVMARVERTRRLISGETNPGEILAAPREDHQDVESRKAQSKVSNRPPKRPRGGKGKAGQ